MLLNENEHWSKWKVGVLLSQKENKAMQRFAACQR